MVLRSALEKGGQVDDCIDLEGRCKEIGERCWVTVVRRRCTSGIVMNMGVQ